MRKRVLFTAFALVGVLAVAGVAYAVNTYNITRGSVSPAGKGSAAAPQAKGLKFGYTVTDSSQPRAKPVARYKIAVAGIHTKYAKNFPSCSYADANGPNHATRCRRAKVGTGRVENLAGPSNDPSNNSFCNLAMVLYNIDRGKGLGIRLDGSPPAPTSQNGPIGCALQVHQAIRSRFKTVRLDGLPTTSLEFSVPENLRHPIPGFDNSVAETTATITRKTKRVRVRGVRRRVGTYSALGCKGRRRTVRVAFTDETGKTSTVSRKTRNC